MKVGLYFGSFNPVHVGHMIIANYMVNNTTLDAIWMVVSPHNPLKNKKTLARDYDRLHLVDLACKQTSKIRSSNVEFSLPKPSYTIDTMVYLEEKYPDYEFSLIMGGDNLATLHKWKNYEILMDRYPIFVYQRPQYDVPEIVNHKNITLCDAPLLQISSSYIRTLIKEKKSIRYLVTDKVYEYLEINPIYDRLIQ